MTHTFSDHTLKGVPIIEDHGWVVVRLAHDQSQWFPLVWTFSEARSRAIELANLLGPAGEDPPKWYAKARRRGEAKVVRCTLTPWAGAS